MKVTGQGMPAAGTATTIAFFLNVMDLLQRLPDSELTTDECYAILEHVRPRRFGRKHRMTPCGSDSSLMFLMQGQVQGSVAGHEWVSGAGAVEWIDPVALNDERLRRVHVAMSAVGAAELSSQSLLLLNASHPGVLAKLALCTGGTPKGRPASGQSWFGCHRTWLSRLGNWGHRKSLLPGSQPFMTMPVRPAVAARAVLDP